MDKNNSKDNIKETPGTKHWLLQTIPPSLMLIFFFGTTSGVSQVFLAGFFIFPAIFSLVSIIPKLIFFNKKKYFLIRPLLTIAIFVLIIVLTNWAYKIALNQAIDEARTIHQLCNKNLVCPENPTGWIRDGQRIRKNDLGFRLKYTASYYYKSESFNMRVDKGPDLGDIITGGVALPFKVDPYVEK